MSSTCGNVTTQRASLDASFADMTTVFFDSSLCELSHSRNIGPNPDTVLVRNIDGERKRYSDCELTGFIYPGKCDASQLSDETGIPEARV